MPDEERERKNNIWWIIALKEKRLLNDLTNHVEELEKVSLNK